MWLRVSLASFLLFANVSAQQKLSSGVVSTTVREDVFAGLLGEDLERLNVRMEKLQAAIQQNPNSASAFAWKGSGELILAVHAHEAGKASEFATHYEAATKCFAEAERLEPKNAGVYDISGATWSTLQGRLPEELRAKANEAAYTSWQTALALSQNRLSSMLPHGRGEMLIGLAQAAQRTGRPDEARQRLTELVAALPGTPFEEAARKWLAEPESIARASVRCQSCHPQERLSSVLTKAR